MTGISHPDPAPGQGASASGFEKSLVTAGLGGLAAISWIYPATTRMYAAPWENILYGTLLVPPLLLLLRARAARARAIPRAWSALAAAAMIVTLAAALASPYRETALRNSAIAWSGIALFFVVLFWIQAVPGEERTRVGIMQNTLGGFFAVMVCLSLAQWLRTVPGTSFTSLANGRNPYPLGHSNYTAGLALLAISLGAGLAYRSSGRARAGWSLLGILAIGLLFTTSSRGGWLGLAALALMSFPQYVKISRRALGWSLFALVLLLLAGLWANPRTRASFRGDELRASDTQRSAMLRAGWLMGHDRPILGWGLGTVPLVYPLYRHQLSGGVEDVLELHSTPPQLWAELGLGGILLGAAALILFAQSARRYAPGRPYLYPFFGYMVFSLTDWQFDVPVFTATLAAGAAGVAAWADVAPVRILISRGRVLALGGTLLLAVAGVCWGVRRDPTTELNTEALLAGQQADASGVAKGMLQTSLAFNPNQEIAHFNFGWLDVLYDPVSAERHFEAAAQLVPDKGGVYFGLGLALLNQDRDGEAAYAWALEALNDPAFLVSPWRKIPRIQNLDTKFPQALQEEIARAQVLAGTDPRALATLAYLRELATWITDGSPVRSADTPRRREFFARQPSPEPLTQAGIIAYHRERTGYPVLMRNLDLPPPVDIFVVQENELAARDWKFLFPERGWLDNRILLQLLSERIAPIK